MAYFQLTEAMILTSFEETGIDENTILYMLKSQNGFLRIYQKKVLTRMGKQKKIIMPFQV